MTSYLHVPFSVKVRKTWYGVKTLARAATLDEALRLARGHREQGARRIWIERLGQPAWQVLYGVATAPQKTGAMTLSDLVPPR